MIRLASYLVAPGGRVHVLHLDAKLEHIAPSQDDIAEMESRGINVSVEYAPDANPRGEVHRYAARHEVDLVLADLPQELHATKSIVRDWRWLREHLPSDSAFIRNRPASEINTICVLGTGGPYDPLKLNLASRIARHENASLRLIHVVQGEASDEQIAAIEEYHARLIETLDVTAVSVVEPANDLVQTVSRLSLGANLVLMGAPSHRFHLVTDLADRIAEQVDCPTLLIHTPTHENMSFRRRIIERFIA